MALLMSFLMLCWVKLHNCCYMSTVEPYLGKPTSSLADRVMFCQRDKGGYVRHIVITVQLFIVQELLDLFDAFSCLDSRFPPHYVVNSDTTV